MHSLPHWAAADFEVLRLLSVRVAWPRLDGLAPHCTTAIRRSSVSDTDRPQARRASPKLPQPLVDLVYVASLPARVLDDVSTAVRQFAVLQFTETVLDSGSALSRLRLLYPVTQQINQFIKDRYTIIHQGYPSLTRYKELNCGLWIVMGYPWSKKNI